MKITLAFKEIDYNLAQSLSGVLLIPPRCDLHATPVSHNFLVWHVMKRIVLLCKHGCTSGGTLCVNLGNHVRGKIGYVLFKKCKNLNTYKERLL
jgi:hypothetical protein